MSIFKTAQAGEVKTKQISKEGCRVTLSVEAAPELVTKNFQNAAVQVQSRAQMQGFRAGKVPLDLVKQNFGGHIKERALDLTVKSAINAALEDAKLDAVAVPTLTKADFANFDEGKTFTFEIAVDVAPEFDVCDYKGIEITKKPETATDEDVTENLNRVLEANARLETAAEGAVIDDKCYAVVHYTGKRNGTEDYKLSADSELVDMAAPQTMPGLAEGIKGLKKGDEKDIEAKEGEDTLSFHVTVDDIKNKIMPALDDNFAKDMGFETLDALKAKVKESLDAEAKQNATRDEIAQIENHLVKANNFELPQSLVEEYTDSSLNNFVRSMTQMKPEQLTAEQRKSFEERIKPSVEKDLRIGYIVHAIAKKENLEAAEADWQAELDKSLASNVQNKGDEKKIKSFFNERKAHILATLTERKVFDFLKAEAKYK
ncbi:MAG: trigger factor [Elusimicrobiaceae bacterium]|uniref:Trigger factor n=1 Tax=Candidatus Avelusimicrobium gallicola TaxID=2562704 RepID=A0A928HJ23_9BACT|nr:trigger factor [Elusimicrobium sp.]MBQ9971222.1 trigger factor [Elusimicrobiaceae bacterium]